MFERLLFIWHTICTGDMASIAPLAKIRSLVITVTSTEYNVGEISNQFAACKCAAWRIPL